MRPALLALLTFALSLSSNILAETITASSYIGGTGTSGDPYQISTLAELRRLSETIADWSSHFIVTADIDTSDTST